MLAPVLGLEYAATAGGGATVNGQPIGPRPVVPLGERLVGTGFSYEQPARARQAGYLARMLPRIRDIRRLGSCALDICGVAAGHLDAYVEEGAHIWDHAAAGLVVEEAGGVLEVTRSPGGKRLLICAPDERFRRVPGPRRRRRFRAWRRPERGTERRAARRGRHRGIADRHLLFMRHGAPGDAVRTGMVHNLAR